MANTSINDVIKSFHTHPLTKKAFPDGLENAWFDSALARFELEINVLNYDDDSQTFDSKLDRAVVWQLGNLMFIEYLKRDIDRIRQLNGFYGKDIHLTGNDESKRTSINYLVMLQEQAEETFHRFKVHAYN